MPKPTAWTALPKVATNSTDRPGEYRPLVPARAPSRLSRPPDTAAPPPVELAALNQSDGRAVPVKSVASAGERMTTPLPAWVTTETFVLVTALLKAVSVVSSNAGV